jgi:hypothetical protein
MKFVMSHSNSGFFLELYFILPLKERIAFGECLLSFSSVSLILPFATEIRKFRIHEASVSLLASCLIETWSPTLEEISKVFEYTVLRRTL